MRIAIMGSGGMGGYVGAKLSSAGHEVIFIARGQHLKAIQKQGLRVLSPDGDIHIQPAQAVEDTTKVGSVDLILFSVKLYDTEAAARSCLPMMDENTFMLSLQNGVESIDLISKIVGNNKTIGGAIYVSAHIESPGVIRHNGGTDILLFAEEDSKPSVRTDCLEKILNEAGLKAKRHDDLHVMLWSKFILLSANAGIGSLTGLGILAIKQDPDMYPLFREAMLEAQAVARAMGVDLQEDLIEGIFKVIENLDGHDLIASQALDLKKGRKMELEWIQGTIHRLGKKHNVPTPVHSTAYIALKRFAGGRS